MGVKKKNNSMVPFLRQLFVTASTATNIMGHGCIIGFSAILFPQLRKPTSYIQVTPAQESWIASIIGFALITGNFIVMPLMENLGRKRSHIITTLPILTGWFLIALSESVTGLIVARFLQGISMGLMGPLGSIIISETTDPKNRGAFLTCVSLSLTIGVLMTHTIGTMITWQQTAIVCSFVSFTSLIMIIFTPESPSWLISKGRYEESSEVFFWLRGDGDDQVEELENMISAHRMMRKSSVAGQKLSVFTRVRRFIVYLGVTFRKPEFYKPICIMFHLYVLFQFSGINVISSYATDIIKQVVGPDANSDLLMVLLDVERLFCNILAIFFMKKLNRRTLLFSTGFICVFSYFAKALYVYAKLHDWLPFDSKIIPITLIAMFMFSLTAGISSVPFTIAGEIFPLEYRGLGGGLGTLPVSINFFIAIKCFPVLVNSIGLTFTYFIYGGVVTYCLIILFFILPETKDKTLQEIEDTLRGRTADKSEEPLNKVPDMMRRYSSQIIY